MKNLLKTRVVALVVAIGLAVTIPAHATVSNNVVVDVADAANANATHVTLTNGQTLWLVEHESVIRSYGFPRSGDIKVTVSDRSVFTPGALADGLTAQDKATLGIAQDAVPLGVYPAKQPGKTEIIVTYTPKQPGQKAFSRTIYVTVK